MRGPRKCMTYFAPKLHVSEATVLLCVVCQGMCRVPVALGSQRPWSSSIPTMKMQPPSSKVSLNHLDTVPASPAVMKDLFICRSPQCLAGSGAGRGPQVGLGTPMALRAQSRRLLSLLLSCFFSFPDLRCCRPSHPFLRKSKDPYPRLHSVRPQSSLFLKE